MLRDLLLTIIYLPPSLLPELQDVLVPCPIKRRDEKLPDLRKRVDIDYVPIKRTVAWGHSVSLEPIRVHPLAAEAREREYGALRSVWVW